MASTASTTSTTSMSAAGPHLVVITEHKVRERAAGGRQGWVPYGVQHAWRPGERRTLCGQWTVGWTVFWERAFCARGHAVCAGCVEATLPEASRRRLDPLDRAS